MAKRSTSRPKSRSQILRRSHSHDSRGSSDTDAQPTFGTNNEIPAALSSDASTCSSSYAAALSEFLLCAAEAEHNIRENGPRGTVPPDCVGDTASERFDNAYKTLSGFLSPPRAKRRFVLSPSLAYLPGMLITETALHAWMLVLNPVGQIYGEVRFLDSEEYREIKRQAVLEAVATWDREYKPERVTQL